MPPTLHPSISQHLGHALVAFKRDTGTDNSTTSSSGTLKILYVAVLIACLCIGAVSIALILSRIRARRMANEALEMEATTSGHNNTRNKKRLLSLEQIAELPVIVLTEEDIQKSKEMALAPTIAAPPKAALANNNVASTELHPSSQSIYSSYYSANEHYSEDTDAKSSVSTPEPAVVSDKYIACADGSVTTEPLQGSEKTTQSQYKQDNKDNVAKDSSSVVDNKSTCETERTSNISDNKDKMLHEENCAVCLDDYNSGDKVRQLPCRHYFHIACIDPWLSMNSATCPLCNFDVASKFSSEEQDEEEDDDADRVSV